MKLLQCLKDCLKGPYKGHKAMGQTTMEHTKKNQAASDLNETLCKAKQRLVQWDTQSG